MIFTRKNDMKITSKRKEAPLPRTPQYSRNLIYSDTITHSLGVEPLTVSVFGTLTGINGVKSMKRLYAFADKLYAWDGLRILYLSENEFVPLVASPTEPDFSPCTLDGSEGAWLTTPTLLLRVGDRAEASLNHMGLKRIHAIGDVFFAVSGRDNSLYISSVNPVEWEADDVNSVQINGIGSLNALFSHNGYLYVFGSLGIARVRYSAGRPLVYTLHLAADKILTDTVCLSGSDFYFCSDGAINRLENSSVIRVADIHDAYPESTARAGFFGDRYVASLKNGLVSIDTRLKNPAPVIDLGMSIFDLTYYPRIGRVAVLADDGAGVLSLSGKYFSRSLPKTCLFRPDLGSPNVLKRLYGLTLTTKYDVDLVFIIDGCELRRSVTGRETPQTVRLNRACKDFAVGLNVRAPRADISAVSFIYEPIVPTGALSQ